MFTISTKTQLNVALVRTTTTAPRSNGVCRAAVSKPSGVAFEATKLKETMKATAIMGTFATSIQFSNRLS